MPNMTACVVIPEVYVDGLHAKLGQRWGTRHGPPCIWHALIMHSGHPNKVQAANSVHMLESAHPVF